MTIFSHLLSKPPKRYSPKIDIAGVNKEVVIRALISELTDFEDAVQSECASQNDINIIITRNIADFKKSKLVIVTPSEFISQYS